MKRLVVLFFVFFLWTQHVFSMPGASATFFSKRGEPFQFLFDGRLVNRGGTNVISIRDIPAGYHWAEFRVPARRGVMVHRTRVLLQPGVQSEFMLQLAGPHLMVRKVAETPLAPVYREPRRYPNYDPYENNNRRPDDGYRNDDYENDRNRNNNQYEEERGNYRNEACADILEKPQVDQLLRSMAHKTESSKQSIARQALGRNSILAEDLKAILQQFEFESSRLDFAKYAYSATCDRRNFYLVNDAFAYETSIRELERFINQQ